MSAVHGSLLGTAVGDALGLPYENLSPRRAARLLGPPTRMRFVLGRGMVSDDFEHAVMAAQAYAEHPADADAFAQRLAGRLRWWLAALPAGLGRATLKAGVRLWLGYGPHNSGVSSAGNGPAMRSAVLGAAIDDLAKLGDYVRASTRLTHTDPRAELGAQAVALAAWCAKRGFDTPGEFFGRCRETQLLGGSAEFAALLTVVEASLAAGEATAAFALSLCGPRGVSGYAYHTVPVCLHAWLSHPADLRAAVVSAIGCGGDADTTAAIVSGIVGSRVGPGGVPGEWLNRVWLWPMSAAFVERLAGAVDRAPARAPGTWFAASLGRNLLFLAAVLGHGFRRLLPPY